MVPLLAVVVAVSWAPCGCAEVAERPWPFYAVGRPVPPEVRQADWVRTAIDRFVLRKLELQGLEPAPEASHRQLARRLYLDLIGLPPTPDEIRDFLDDSGDDAYERLVDRLLDDPRYAERWARRWLDLARYADTAGYEGDPDLPHAWRYRDYVIDSFNQDKPYDQFVREQIAGDEFEEIMGAGDLPDIPAERVVAMTFLRLAPFTEPRGDESRHELLSEMTSTVGSVFLGLTLGCAKCHDHKYDEIPTADFYRMQAFFATVQLPRPERGDGYQIGGSLDAPFYRSGEESWAQAERERLKQESQTAARELPALRYAIARRLGLAPLPPAEDLEKVIDPLAEAKDPRMSATERHQLDYWKNRARFVQQHLKRLLPVAMSLRHSYGPPYEPGVPTTRVMLRGEYDHPGEIVEPGFPSVIAGDSRPAAIRLDPFKRWPTRSRRQALAAWITSPDNPLTARVIANRLWYWHFGQGIVPTPSDFGQLSGGPSHPELLDWLARQLLDRHWSLKSLQRQIVTSQTYRQSSLHALALAESQDPDNRLLWRFPRRRLEAEAIRDSVLAVSGRLNLKPFGLPIFPPLPDDVAQTVRYGESKWDTQYGPEGRKRSVYIYQQRTLTMPFMQTFDALVCDESQPLRRASVTPLQALAMYNSEFVNEEAQYFAERIQRQVGDHPLERVAYAFEAALGRVPERDEMAPLLALCQAASDPDQGLVRVCRVLFNANEFLYID